VKKRIGCLHAHYSNIDYIQNAISSDELELVHFVDPGLMNRMTTDQNFDETKAKNKVIEQIEWISQANVDAILITCTNYIFLFEENRLNTTVPILKIDEPFFSSVCNITEPQILLFTNPATVEGTMSRLNEFSSKNDKSISNIEARVIENTFELIMQGKKEQYGEAVATYIKGILESEKNKQISVAQLSMVDTAKKIEHELNVEIANPLRSLVTYMDRMLLN
jgi:glutamate racemase